MKHLLKLHQPRLRLRCALVVAAMSAGVVCAQNIPATSTTEAQDENSKGAGATRLRTTESEGAGAVALPVSSASFIKEAHEANQTEIALAELAERKSQNSEVKDFAKQMREDHQKADRDLMPVAQAHNVTLDQSLDAKHQKTVDRFQKLSGTEFDKEFMTTMLRDHQKVVNKFDQAARQLPDNDVKQYAQTTLPTLRQHLHHAQTTALAAGVDQATISSIVKESDAMGGTSDDMQKESGTVQHDKGDKDDQK